MENPNEQSLLDRIGSIMEDRIDRIGSIFHKESGSASKPAPQIVIRNCSSMQMKVKLFEALGETGDASGRYFVPATQDEAKIREVASSLGLFVNASRLANVTILDLMVDREKEPSFGRAAGAGARFARSAR